MQTLVAHFAADESGEAAIEYGVLAAAIAVAIAAVIGQIGGQLNTPFDTVQTGRMPKAG
jgi:pilus assembly protein Flp/PilA